ncbi:glycogen debranching protein [Paenibacillus sp. MER 180]|uniref:alpha-L-rhamnosidase-related protein n=1 Tax=Paenibacillus sp. MER 180 TaxID=2939570 RepID=UPI00203B78E4|nr:glycogen debranching protein [Paenibacillus sp. MER 180]MCM3289507.1 glycogen debranching protein [Paenibacillus sp. MER 180]
MSSKISRHPFNVYLNAGEYVKVNGTQDGYFPDFGHHVANEMGGVWLHPVKLLDGFWLKVTDTERHISVWSKSDSFENLPWGSRFGYDHGLGHIPVEITRTQFAPELEKGFVVHYEIHNYADCNTHLSLELLARTDLRPVWFSEEIGIQDGEEDTAQILTPRTVLAKDCDHEWYVLVGTDLPGDQVETGRHLFGPEFTSGKGTGITFAADVTLAAGERLSFHVVIAGSYMSREECEQTYRTLSTSHSDLLKEKQALYEQIAQRAELEIEGESTLNEVFAWVKWNNQWLVQTVDGIGRGLTAGSPHYPWWFGCDNTYALQGVLAIGDQQLVRDTMGLLRKKSKEVNGNGRIVHEITTMGVVSNPGNTQETAHFIAFVWEMFCWIGDVELLREYYPDCVHGLQWLLEEMDPDADLLPSGYGIIEIAGLNMELIDSAVYTVKAVEALMHMSAVLEERENHERYNMLYERIREAVEALYWCEEESLYADAVAAKKDIAPKAGVMAALAEKHGIADYREYIEDLLARQSDEEQERGWLLNKNWVIVTPMEAGIAQADRAQRALASMRNEEFIGEYGTYLAALYKQGMMTISTGAHAVAEATYGNADAALDLLNRMLRSYSMVLPGSMSEMSPDYGCAVQAWTTYALAVPVIRHFFGIKPEAYRSHVRLEPVIPTAWAGKRMRLQQVRIGKALFDISLTMSAASKLHVEIDNPDAWSFAILWNGQTVESSEKHIHLQI